MMERARPRIPILVVDDDESVLEAYGQVFGALYSGGADPQLADLRSKLFGGGGKPTSPDGGTLFDLEMCRGAEAAVVAVKHAIEKERRYPVIFLDMRMPPGPDGAWAAARIRELDPTVDIVISTAFTDVDPASLGVLVPPMERLFYVRKPFHAQEIRQLGLALGRKHEAEASLRHLAYFDRLTALPNRELFHARLTQALELARRHDRSLAVLFLDLDNLERVNDTLGHAVGDTLLTAVAERLARCVRASDAVMPLVPSDSLPSLARLDGDEFTVLLSEIADFEDALRAAERVLASLSQPIRLIEHEIAVTCSIGVAVFPGHGEDADSLLKSAYLAMQSAKRKGGSTIALYEASMTEVATRRLRLENHLRQALERGELLLYYQPQLDLRTGDVCGVEALLRWTSPDLGMVPPLEFIPVAESSGLMVGIGEWVLREACSQTRSWQQEGVLLPRVAVNVSVSQFVQTNFHDSVARVLQETGLEPASLELEITESLLVRDADEACESLERIKRMGVQIAIDDFGAGYSSLSRLKDFPIDRLKIDKSFVDGLTTDGNDRAIATAVIAMARGLAMKVLAEGVESSDQADFLRSAECDEAQGYLWSRPLPSEDAKAFLLQHARRAK